MDSPNPGPIINRPAPDPSSVDTFQPVQFCPLSNEMYPYFNPWSKRLAYSADGIFIFFFSYFPV